MKGIVKLTAAAVALVVSFVALTTITSPAGAAAITAAAAPKTKVVINTKVRAVAKKANLTKVQIHHAHTIVSIAVAVAVAVAKKLPERAAVIAVATAMQESSLRNLNYGDRDSLGLFQQRPSSGWGRPDQVTDPQYSTRKFLAELQRVPRWQTRPLTEAAQKVQRSAFPNACARWEPLAEKLTTTVIQRPAIEKSPSPKKTTTLKTADNFLVGYVEDRVASEHVIVRSEQFRAAGIGEPLLDPGRVEGALESPDQAFQPAGAQHLLATDERPRPHRLEECLGEQRMGRLQDQEEPAVLRLDDLPRQRCSPTFTHGPTLAPPRSEVEAELHRMPFHKGMPSGARPHRPSENVGAEPYLDAHMKPTVSTLS